MEEAIEAIIRFAKESGVGFWELVGGLSVVVAVFKLPEILKVCGEFLNERKRIIDATALKMDQARRTLETARARREKAGQRK